MKKVKISISIDSELLDKLDAFVRRRQRENLDQSKALTNRSKVIEEIVREFIERVGV